MSELEKITQRNKETMRFETDEIEQFIDGIEKGIYPPKCLKCYRGGIRFCGYWEEDYNCEEVEEGEVGSIVKKFIKRSKYNA